MKTAPHEPTAPVITPMRTNQSVDYNYKRHLLIIDSFSF